MTLLIILGVTLLPITTFQVAPTAEIDPVRVVINCIPFVASLPFWLQARAYKRDSAESRRLQLQTRLVEPYISEMSEPAKTIMKASLAPRIFSRLIEDQDPIREPIWPSSDVLRGSKLRLTGDQQF